MNKTKMKKIPNRSYLVRPFWHKTIKIEGALILSKTASVQKLFFTLIAVMKHYAVTRPSMSLGGKAMLSLLKGKDHYS